MPNATTIYSVAGIRGVSASLKLLLKIAGSKYSIINNICSYSLSYGGICDAARKTQAYSSPFFEGVTVSMALYCVMSVTSILIVRSLLLLSAVVK